MGRITTWRVLIGGLLAGAVLFVGQYLVQDKALAQFWAEMAKGGQALPMDQVKTSGAIPAMATLDVLTGFLLAWFYAAVRPRLGAGPMTAIVVGLAVWAVLLLQSELPTWIWTPKFREWSVTTGLGNVVLYTVATVVAGWVYGEPGDGSPRRRR